MNIGIIRILTAGLVFLASYPISTTIAWADWGCQVLLCLSNPGGATEFSECRPPIQKLWSELAKGHSFPTCQGVGFSTSRPRYEPYYCDKGYRLITQSGRRGPEATCISITRPIVRPSDCATRYGDDDSATRNQVARWERVDGETRCTAQITQRPNVRSQPRYVDVTIDGAGVQRVWF